MTIAKQDAANVPPSRPGPEERLESLRFFVAEGGYDTLPKSLIDWMQEAEKQIAVLRKRLNGLADERQCCR